MTAITLAAAPRRVMSPFKAQTVMLATIGIFTGLVFAFMRPYHTSLGDKFYFIFDLLLFPGLALLGITLYAHRDRTHKSIILAPPVAFLCRTFIFLLGMKPWEWVAVHTIHHKYSDTEKDPHSPWFFGFWWVYLGTAVLFNRAKKRHADVKALIARHVANMDWLDRNIFKWSFFGPLLCLPFLQLVLMFVRYGVDQKLLWVLFAWPMAIVIFLWGGGAVNAISHTAPVRDGKTRDHSLNTFWLWRTLTLGEFNHHWHHLKASSARFGPIAANDLGYCFTWVLCRFKLARIRKVFDQDLSPEPMAA